MAIIKEPFGTSRDDANLYLYTIMNDKGTKVTLSNYGATVVSILFQDKNEKMQDVVLGYDTPEDYEKNTCHFGAVIGRNGNRIDRAQFHLDGKEYHLAVNDNENNLHSGNDYFGKRVWNVEECYDNSIKFSLEDKDLQQGFPGNFRCSITYTLTHDNALRLHYEAECDQDTVANMTNHTYFNLGGHDSGTILDHELTIYADHYTPVRDYQAIPTGEVAAVEGTPMDFRTAKTIGRDIEADFEQLHHVGGYDHNYAIRPDRGPVIRIAQAYCPRTGINMEVFTDLPGVQFYAGNFIDEGMKGKGGAVYGKRDGFCLETQYYPNSVNQEGFAHPLLKAGEKYDTLTTYRFSVR